jgi:hypothetical protein
VLSILAVVNVGILVRKDDDDDDEKAWWMEGWDT